MAETLPPIRRNSADDKQTQRVVYVRVEQEVLQPAEARLQRGAAVERGRFRSQEFRKSEVVVFPLTERGYPI